MEKKRDILLIGLGVWSLIAAVILALVAWNHLSNKVYETGVLNGATETAARIYNDIIDKSANNKCNTVFVQYDGRRVDLINVRCLQVQNTEEEATEAK
ncbi:MAG: hypothetical protein ACON41_05245 [Parvibaculales bacterium]